MTVRGAKAVPNDDPRLDDYAPGECRLMEDGIFLIRESEWLTFISMLSVRYGKAHGDMSLTLFG